MGFTPVSVMNLWYWSAGRNLYAMLGTWLFGAVAEVLDNDPCATGDKHWDCGVSLIALPRVPCWIHCVLRFASHAHWRLLLLLAKKARHGICFDLMEAVALQLINLRGTML